MQIRMNMRSLSVCGVIALALLIASGLWAGHLTRRWGEPREYHAAREMLRSFPEQIGAWRKMTTHTMSPQARDMLQCGDAYVDADYQHEQTREVVRLTIIAGPYGPLSVHKPSVCYPNLGLETVQAPQVTAVTGPQGAQGEFFSAVFQSSEPGAPPHHVYYAWNKGAGWQVAEVPRFAFGGVPVLFKLQLDAGPPVDGTEETDPGRLFLKEFLPIWGTLSPAREGTGSILFGTMNAGVTMGGFGNIN